MAKKRSHGTTLKINGTACSQIRNITPPPMSRDPIIVTDLDSTIQEKLPSDPEDIGDVTFEQIWDIDSTNHNLLQTAFDSMTEDTYIITYTNASKTATFTAYCINLTPAQVVDKTAFARTVTLMPTSKPAYAAA